MSRPETVVHSWEEASSVLSEMGYRKKVLIPKRSVTGVPSDCKKTSLYIRNGCQKSYREDTATDSLHIREYERHHTVERDKYHPEYHPIQHAVYDGVSYMVAVARSWIDSDRLKWV